MGSEHLLGLKRYGYLEVRDEELKLTRKSKNQKKEKWKERYEKQLLEEGDEAALAELEASKFKQPKVDADGNPLPKGPTQNKNAIMILNDKYKVSFVLLKENGIMIFLMHKVFVCAFGFFHFPLGQAQPTLTA